MEQTLEIMDKDFTGLCFVNLVNFDVLGDINVIAYFYEVTLIVGAIDFGYVTRILFYFWFYIIESNN